MSIISDLLAVHFRTTPTHHQQEYSSAFLRTQDFYFDVGYDTIKAIHQTNVPIDCSTQTSPCPSSCMEVPDCGHYKYGVSCGVMLNLYQYSIDQAQSLFSCSCTCQDAKSSTNDDPLVRQSLMSLNNVTNGADWFVTTNWDTLNLTYCSYWGIYCYNYTNHVIAIGLTNNNLEGLMPSEIFNVSLTQSSLKTLWLNSNSLSGTIPTGIYNLKVLKSLILTSNDLEGNIYLYIFINILFYSSRACT